MTGPEGEGSNFDQGFYEEQFRRFEKLGEAQVSSLLQNRQMPLQDIDAAREWLGRKARAHAERANHKATTAIIIAITSMIITISGIVITHLDTIQH